MKTVDAGQFAANILEYLQASKTEAIVVTESGKPCAVVQGLDYDEEQLALANSSEFWAMIEKRRKGKMIPWNEVKATLSD